MPRDTKTSLTGQTRRFTSSRNLDLQNLTNSKSGNYPVNITQATLIVPHDVRYSQPYNETTANSLVPDLEKSVREDARGSLTNSSSCNEKKFLVSVCSTGPCGGWANRQRGIISTYLLSVLMNRTFSILHDKPCDISTFLERNEYDWASCNGYVEKISQTNANSPNIELLLNVSNFENYNKEHVIFIRTHHYWINQIAKHPKTMQRLPWVINKTTPEVSRIVLSRLFRPVELLEKAIRNFTDKVGDSKQLICTHIRMGKNPTMPNDSERRVPNVSVIFNWLRKFDKPQNYSIFIASDSEDIKTFARTNFTNVLLTKLPIVHVDRVRKDQSNMACEGLFSTFLEQHILSRCDILLLTLSNFGPMAAYMSRKQQTIYIHKWNTIFEVPFNNVPKLF